jgi:outer membrane immunogenic protein
MSRVLTGVAVASLITCTVASAADIPLKVPAPPPVFSWTGVYIGVNGGYGWASDPATFSSPPPVVPGERGNLILNTIFANNNIGPNSYPLRLDEKGFVGGGQLGYNWQIARDWVVGVETDIQFADIKGSPSVTGAFADCCGGVFPLRLDVDHRLKWFGTMRGRIGFAIDRFLVFGTGGLAYGETDASARIANIGPLFTPGAITCPSGVVCFAGSESRTSIGWTAGGGFEWAFWGNATFKTEYLHVELGDQTVRLKTQLPATGPGVLTGDFVSKFDLVRAGLNWKF